MPIPPRNLSALTAGTSTAAKTFTFSDDTATITLTDGSSQTHTYTYLGQYKVGDGETMVYNGQEIDPSFACDVYQSPTMRANLPICSSATTRWLRPIILSSATAAILTRCRNTSPARMPTGSLPASTRAADAQTIDNVIRPVRNGKSQRRITNNHPPYTNPKPPALQGPAAWGIFYVCAAPSTLMTAPVT